MKLLFFSLSNATVDKTLTCWFILFLVVTGWCFMLPMMLQQFCHALCTSIDISDENEQDHRTPKPTAQLLPVSKSPCAVTQLRCKSSDWEKEKDWLWKQTWVWMQKIMARGTYIGFWDTPFKSMSIDLPLGRAQGTEEPQLAKPGSGVWKSQPLAGSTRRSSFLHRSRTSPSFPAK